MSNVLKVSLQTIHSLADRRWSQRRIARELGINRETVGRYLQELRCHCRRTVGRKPVAKFLFLGCRYQINRN
jgi:predicted transcriptional regulator